MPLAYVHFLPDRDQWGRPVDPGYGVEGGGHPDQGLPGQPGRPGHLPSYGGGRPVDPGYGVGDGSHPDQGLPGQGGRPGHLPAYGGGRPVDPGFGWEGRPGAGAGHLPALPPGGSTGQLPELPVAPDHGHVPGIGQLPVWPAGPDNTLPPGPDNTLPPTDLPPGTIWPPLPPSVPAGKHIALVAISGVGYRYVVVTITPPAPGQGLPAHPSQGLPPTGGAPPQPGQGLPPPQPQPRR